MKFDKRVNLYLSSLIENYTGNTNPLNIPSLDTWHAAQELAIQGKTQEAISMMNKAATQAKTDDSQGIVKYYLGTIAWLNKDYNTVNKYINDAEVKQTGTDKVLYRLLQNKNRDYNTAYNAV